MLEELKQLKLTVCLVPDGRPNSFRSIRCVMVPNPDWYSRLCQQFLALRLNRKWKRPRTIIKRGLVLRHLERIAKCGIDLRLTYHQRILDAIEWFAATRWAEPKQRSTHTHTHTQFMGSDDWK